MRNLNPYDEIDEVIDLLNKLPDSIPEVDDGIAEAIEKLLKIQRFLEL